MARKYINVEVDISDFTDEELIEELKWRNNYDDQDTAKEIVNAYRLKTPGWENRLIEFVHELAGKAIV